MSDVVLLLGGNEEGTYGAFVKALAEIQRVIGPEKKRSSLYASPPWGFEHYCDFLNQAVMVSTTLSPSQLLEETQLLEKQLGRKTKTTIHYEGRLIDIDILFVGNSVVQTSDLQIPHPRLHLRRFTLVPLNELIPDFVHPVLQKPIGTLLSECTDDSEVTIVE